MGAEERERQRQRSKIEPSHSRSVFKNGMVRALKEIAASGRFAGVTVTTLATPGQEYDLPNTGIGFGSRFGKRKGIVPDGMEWVAVADTRGDRLEEFQREAAAILTTRSKAAPSRR